MIDLLVAVNPNEGLSALEIGTLVAFTSLLAFVAGLGSAVAIIMAIDSPPRRSGRH